MKELNPMLHPLYLRGIRNEVFLPKHVQELVTKLVACRRDCSEDEIDMIDRQIVAKLSWYVLHPDELAKSAMRVHGLLGRRVLSMEEAAKIILAIGEAGYPITGNGAPDYGWKDEEFSPVRGPDRERVLSEAARYWAKEASIHCTYISFGDHRGYMPRSVQYDQPGSMNPNQQAALTFGPACDRGGETNPHGYMRKHTRLLLLVR